MCPHPCSIDIILKLKSKLIIYSLDKDQDTIMDIAADSIANYFD